MKKKLKAVGYTRVSTLNQVDNTSLDYQRRKIKGYAKSNDIELIKVFREEGRSATDINRPEYLKMINFIEGNDIDVLLVHKLDRLHREETNMFNDLKQFRKKGRKIIFIDPGLDSSKKEDWDAIVDQIVAASRFSRNLGNESIKGLSTRAADGMHTGGKPPYGFNVNRDTMLLEIDDTTAPAVKKMFQLYAEGFGTADIIKWLKDNGYKTSNGNDFKVNTINEILHNEKYKGCYTWNKAVSKDSDGKRNTHKHKDKYLRIEGGCPAIVSAEVFDKVQQRLAKNAKKFNNRTPDRYYPLTGMIYCSCGSPMCGGVKYSKDKKYYKYNCNNKCGISPIRADYMEAFVINAISTCLFSEPNRQPLIDSLNNISNSIKNSSDKEYRALRRKLSGLDERHNNLMKALEKGKVTDSIMNNLEKIERQKDETNFKIKLLSRETNKFTESDLEKLQENFDNYIMTENTINNKYLLRKIVDRVVVGEDTVNISLKCGISINKTTKILLKGNDDMIKRGFTNRQEISYRDVEGIILGLYGTGEENCIGMKLALMVNNAWSYDIVDIELPNEYIYNIAQVAEKDIYDLVGAEVAAKVKLCDKKLSNITELGLR